MSNEIDLTETLATVHGCLGDDLFEILASETLAGRRQEAMGLLRAYAVPDCIDVHTADAFLDGLLAERTPDKAMDGMAVLEDLSVQPCQGEVLRLAAAGAVHGAAVVAMVHEGYPADAALAAAGMAAKAQRGEPVDLVETDLASISAELESSRETVVVRHGRRIMSGHVRTIGSTVVFDGGGEPVRLALVDQGWRSMPRDPAPA